MDTKTIFVIIIILGVYVLIIKTNLRPRPKKSAFTVEFTGNRPTTLGEMAENANRHLAQQHLQ